MPLVQSIISPLSDTVPTHEDIYGKGGYVIIDTGEIGKTNINDWITEERRKEGMVVYDINIDQHHRCLGKYEGTNPDDNWELTDFGGGIGATSLDELSDVVIDAGTYPNAQSLDSFFLRHDGTAWKPFDLYAQFPTTTDGELDVASGAQIDLLISLINSLEIPTLLNDLTNVNASPSNGQVLTYDQDSDTWVASDIRVTIDGTDDVIPPLGGKYIVWGPEPELTNELVLVGGSGITVTADSQIGNIIVQIDATVLTTSTSFASSFIDISILNEQSGDMLVYDGTSGWVNSNVIYGGSSTSF